ncbi:MAG: amidohydrolase family protein [Balneolaceae bacterium]|nr:amidohydrolase family protein [Balneolaceae bacterium]
MKYFSNHLLGSLLCLIITLTGCQSAEEYYNLEDYRSVEKIDTHVHINTSDHTLIEQAQKDNFRLITVNVDSPSYPDITVQREVGNRLRNETEGLTQFLTTISLENWDDADLWVETTIAYLEESIEKGAIGVKFWKNIGMEFKNAAGDFVMIDDPQFDPVFEFLTERGIPVLGHIGEPYSCWQPLEEMGVNFVREYYENHPQYHMYLHPENPSYDEIITSRNNMLDKHPDLIFIGAHLGSMEWSVEMMREHLDRYPNMVYDMAHRVTLLQYLTQQDRDGVRRMFIDYPDRFVYSTDIQHHLHSDPENIQALAERTWKQDWEYFTTDHEMIDEEVNDQTFRGLKLPKDVVDKLYRLNAERVFKGI